MKRRFLPVLLSAAALALTACGGSSTPAGTGTGTGTGTTAVIHQVCPTSSACRSFDARLGSLCMRANNAFGAAHSNQGRIAVVARYIALFSAVTPPPQLRTIYTQYLHVLQKELAALKRGDENELFRLAHSEAKPLVKRIGAEGCVTGS